MYCRNCGREVDEKAAVCVGCGVPPLKGCQYCQNCGTSVDAAAELCVSCGSRLLRAGASATDDKTWALLSHLSILVLGFLGPLLIFLIKGKDSELINDQSKEALNFSITLAIGYLVSGILCLIVIGIITSIALLIVQVVFPILAAIQSNNGVRYRYPMTLRLIK